VGEPNVAAVAGVRSPRPLVLPCPNKPGESPSSDSVLRGLQAAPDDVRSERGGGFAAGESTEERTLPETPT
jgi:hypothetical protein